VIAEERAESIRTEGVQTSWRLVSSDYLSTMGVPLLKGRVWAANEAFASRPVVISQDLASRLWPRGEDPIGRQVRMSNTRTFTVIGIAANVRHRTMTDREPTNTIYWPASYFNWDTMTIVLRTNGEPSAMAASMREAMRRVDPMQPLFEISTVEDSVARTASAPRLAALLLGLFAGLALLLAVVGVAGLTAYAVARRRSELAIRLALGATGLRVIKDVTSEQFRLCAAGVVAGVLMAWWLRPLVASMLFGVEPEHVPAYAGAGLLLLSSGLLACLLPAIRIARIDPASALRND
jgi:putative ABC transport system permease protein